jgi:hypothetical protein
MAAMRTARLVAVCISISSVSSLAIAGGYAGMAIGTQAGIEDDFQSTVAIPAGRSFRLLGGWRFAQLAGLSVEGGLNTYGMMSRMGGETRAWALSAGVKYSLPFGNDFEGFARGGLERTWLSLDDYREELVGNGWLLGVGFEYRLDKLLAMTTSPIRAGSLFVDYSIHRTALDDSTQGVHADATPRFFSFGFTVGF